MDRNLYIKIAYWYYTLGMTQEEIAKRLSFTRQKVNQIINSLMDLDIVSINIHGYDKDNIELECRIEEQYSLSEVLIANDFDAPDESIYRVANVAAQYLDEKIMQGDIIGVSWGRTLSEVIKQLPFNRKSECRVVQLMGAQNIDQAVEKSDDIARGMANRLDCPSNMLYAPIVVEHAETKEWLMKERGIIRTHELMKQCDIALVGVGELTETSTMCARGHLTVDDIKKLNSLGFVGDMAMNPMREDGSWNDCFISPRIIGADMECLRKIKNIVLVACGEKKTRAIRAALRSGVVDTLITDKNTAERIL